MRRALLWLREDAAGAEFCTVRLDADGLRASGIAVGDTPAPYRLDYELATDARLVTRRVHLSSAGDLWARELSLDHDGSGRWTSQTKMDGESDLPTAGGDVAALTGALDCDIAFSPLTNTMPILRLGLRSPGAPRDILAAWVSVPDLGVDASRQRYEPIAPDRVRYRSGSFTATIEIDPDGFVRYYPGIARRSDTLS